LDGDVERVRAVRQAAPAARLIVDANESRNECQLGEYMPMLIDLRVALIKQPLPADADDALARLEHPILLCADESCRTLADLDRLGGKYQAINIKLDIAGGVTEARAGGGSEAAGLADHGRRRDQHVAWDRAGAAHRTAGQYRRSRRTIAFGARSRGDGSTIHPPDPKLWTDPVDIGPTASELVGLPSHVSLAPISVTSARSSAAIRQFEGA
jgi:hypothetical protein